MTGCQLCGVGPEDDCRMDCSSRLRPDPVKPVRSKIDAFDSVIANMAVNVSTSAHKGQFRKFTNEQYIHHPVRVARSVERAGAPQWVVAAALLHDVIEDTSVTADDLRLSFDDTIVDLVLLMTHSPDESYMDYIDRICTNPNAWLIKRADILDNMATLPIGHRLMNKYTVALDMMCRAVNKQSKGD